MEDIESCNGARQMEKGTEDGYAFLLAKYKLLFDHARDMILFIDQDGKILDANSAALSVYGYSHEEITNMYVFSLRESDPPALVKSQMQQACSSSILFETMHKTKDGRVLPVEVSSTGVVVDGRRILMSIIRDISLKKEYLSRIERLAYYDELTGVLNRKSFRDALKSLIERGSGKFALMLIDIDNFKRVNDSYSHSVGDRFLVEISKCVSEYLGSRGKFFRLGGDEFTVLIDGFTDREDLSAIASGILEVGRRRFEIDSFVIESSLSIGISLFPEDTDEERCLLKRADLAMYRVKESTKDNFAFSA
jgi:diguanylate cyclase (GGDEF)-like protein/PAS domain S-box-containing protein